jgi:hypothetical protein
VGSGVDGPDLVGPPPRPPAPGRSEVADRLLLMFGFIAGAMLVTALALTALLIVFRPATDISSLANLINTQLSLIIGAVLGYAAHPNGGDRRDP